MCHVRVPVSQKIAFPMEFPPPSDVSPPKNRSNALFEGRGRKKRRMGQTCNFQIFVHSRAAHCLFKEKRRRLEGANQICCVEKCNGEKVGLTPPEIGITHADCGVCDGQVWHRKCIRRWYNHNSRLSSCSSSCTKTKNRSRCQS